MEGGMFLSLVGALAVATWPVGVVEGLWWNPFGSLSLFQSTRYRPSSDPNVGVTSPRPIFLPPLLHSGSRRPQLQAQPQRQGLQQPQLHVLPQSQARPLLEPQRQVLARPQLPILPWLQSRPQLPVQPQPRPKPELPVQPQPRPKPELPEQLQPLPQISHPVQSVALPPLYAPDYSNPPLVSAPQNGLVYVENSIPPGIETGDGSHSVVGNATDAGDDENVVYLDFPDPRLCSQRPGHEKFDGHYYYLSWRDPTFDHFLSWLEGRNFCRRMCMDLVSLETPEENLFVTGLFESAASQGVTNSTWTSGLVCNFPGCEAEELQPARENGWFWSGSGVRISAKGSPTGFTDWSTVGGAGSGQPDDLEGEENCIALFGPTVYGDPDGHPHWHDVSCHTDRDVVCEDDPKLIEYVKTNYDISFQRK